MSIILLLVAVAGMAVSGVPSLLLGPRSMSGQWIAAVINVLCSALGGVGLLLYFTEAQAASQFARAWSLPLGRFSVAVDDLTAIFLLPILFISALGSIYGLEYWKQSRHPGNGRMLRFYWGLLTAAMMLVVLARDGVLFLIAWEIMSLAGFFLVATEDKKPEVRRAAWVYLVAMHVGAESFRDIRTPPLRQRFIRALAKSRGRSAGVGHDRGIHHRCCGFWPEGGNHAASRLVARRTRQCAKPCFGHLLRSDAQDRDLWNHSRRVVHAPPTAVVGHNLARRGHDFGRAGDCLRRRPARFQTAPGL